MARVRFPAEEIFLFSIASSFPFKVYQTRFHRGVKRLGVEADHSSPSAVEIKKWSYTSTPPYVFMA
jgi:hypothetical protein